MVNVFPLPTSPIYMDTCKASVIINPKIDFVAPYFFITPLSY